LLGTGTLISRTLGIFSTGNRSIAMNVSLGASVATANLEARQFVGIPPDELNLALGIDYAVVPRVTVSADVVGHSRLSGSNTKMGQGLRPVQFVDTPNGPVQSQILSEFQSYGTVADEMPVRGEICSWSPTPGREAPLRAHAQARAELRHRVHVLSWWGTTSRSFSQGRRRWPIAGPRSSLFSHSSLEREWPLHKSLSGK
jgi:hypothetical protein